MLLAAYRFVFPVSRLSRETWCSFCDSCDYEIPHSHFVIASGSLPQGAPSDAYANIVRSAKTYGARVIVDTSGAPLKHALEAGPYLVKPNLRELSEYVGKTLSDDRSQLATCRELIDETGAEIVALTLGAQGALVVTKKGAWHAQAPEVKVISTVGAGDSFLGAMALKLGSGESVAQSLRFAVAAGMAALLSPGTELCRPEDVERLVHDVTVREIDW